jgi:DUF438 domain-containing protein
MSELINNSRHRKERLKELILKLHQGVDPIKVKEELIGSLKQIPYGEVVEVEQELISEGLPEEEVIKLCDIHGDVLEGHIDQSGSRSIPAGHPVDVMIKENIELNKVIEKTQKMIAGIETVSHEGFGVFKLQVQFQFNELMDVDKHYKRKEYLLFPFLEKNGITGPPKVMWGKHDEIREQLKGAIEILRTDDVSKNDLIDVIPLLFDPLLKAMADMVKKEEEILFPMSMDMLTTEDWWNIHRQTMDFGYTLYDPQEDWMPEGMEMHENDDSPVATEGSTIKLPSGSFTAGEIMAILNTIPVDMTFVDKNDKVKYFTQGKERIFARSRTIINRDVRLCHPPGSVHVIEKILEDFKSGKADHAPFWIQMHGKFIHIEYFALRDERGEYLGTLEFSQDLSDLRKLEGERRILSYTEKKD